MLQTFIITGILAIVGIAVLVVICCLLAKSRKLDHDRQVLEDKAQEEWCEKISSGKQK